jgi:hypothetical protein
MVAEGLLLVHRPPVMISLKVSVPPTHTLAGPPVIAAGIGFTVIVFIAAQPALGRCN